MIWAFLHLTIVVSHVHCTILSHKLSLKVVFLFQSFLVITVAEVPGVAQVDIFVRGHNWVLVLNQDFSLALPGKYQNFSKFFLHYLNIQ